MGLLRLLCHYLPNTLPLGQTSSHMHYIYISLFFVGDLDWYNWTGRLDIKHQVTYFIVDWLILGGLSQVSKNRETVRKRFQKCPGNNESNDFVWLKSIMHCPLPPSPQPTCNDRGVCQVLRSSHTALKVHLGPQVSLLHLQRCAIMALGSLFERYS